MWPKNWKMLLIDEGYSQPDSRYISRINQLMMSKDDRNQPSTSLSGAASAVDEYSNSVSTSDSEFSFPPAKRPNIQNRQDSINLALMCEPFHVSDRTDTVIASAVLKDFGVIDDKTPTKVIHRRKLRLERQKCWQKLREDEE